MRDCMRRYAMYERDRKRGKIVVPVTVVPVSMLKRTLAEPRGEVLFQRPMSKKQIWKNDRDGVIRDAKEFPVMRDEKLKVWWAYSNDPNETQVRMSQAMIPVNLKEA